MIAGKRQMAAAAVNRAPLRRLSGWRGVLILNYHRVGDAQASDADRSLWSATAEQFDAHLSELSRQADVIGPGDLEEVVRRGRGRHVMLTFDDGYRDNYEIAFPLLRAYDMPATFFLTTGFLDQPRAAWWDEIAWMLRHAKTPLPDVEAAIALQTTRYKRLVASQTERFLDRLAEETGAGRCDPRIGAREWMTWDMAREMRDNGMFIGGHTVDHPILSSLPAASQEQQVRGCAARLEAELAAPGNDLVGVDRAALEQRIRVAGARAGAFNPHCARVQPAKLVQGLAAAVERLGARIHESTAVTSVVPRAAITPNGTVRAGTVLVCLEGFTASLAGHRRTWLPLNSAMVVTAPLDAQTWAQIGWDPPSVLGDEAHAYMYAQRTGFTGIALGGRGVCVKGTPGRACRTRCSI